VAPAGAHNSSLAMLFIHSVYAGMRHKLQ